MTRVTRSRQAATAASENSLKTTVKRSNTGAVTKKTIGKTRSTVKKVSNQDENAVPTAQINKVSKGKAIKSKGLILGAKLIKDKVEPLPSTVLTMKSPVLRDRTNTTNELSKVDVASKLPSKIPPSENKKPAAVKRTTRNTKKQSNLNVLNVSIERYTVKLPKAQTTGHAKKTIEKVSEKKDINENVDKSGEEQSWPTKTKSENTKASKRMNMSMEDVEKLLNGDDDVDDEEEDDVEDHEEHSPPTKSKPEIKKALKRKNMSDRDVEKLLNEDNDEDVEKSDDEETDSLHEENAKKEDNSKPKKFFKYKGTEEETKPVVPAKKNPSQNKKGRVAKKAKNSDNSFSPGAEGPKQSTKPENKKLRTRAVKNYCETTRLSNSKDEAKKTDDDKPTESDHKSGPIYKAIKQSEEQKKDEPDEIYEFELSQDDGQKGKKRKKTVKRPAVKRAKKAANTPFGFAPLPKRKPAKAAAVGKNVQLKVENVNKVNTNAVLAEKKVDNAVNAKKNTIAEEIETNFEVPDDPPEMGGSSFDEAPTIKIVSDERLEGNKKFHLTTTPAAPKTAKVFGPKIKTLSQPNQQLKTMANHSLIRESMSPIKRISDEFDAGSPWRAPVDAFTRVRRVVQSTPQVKRHAAQIEKKPLEHVAELNKKSFGSEETIHTSTAANNKSPVKERSLDEMSTIKQDEPRKFGTVISNLSPTKSTSTVNSSNNSTTQKSPTQGTSLQSAALVNNQQSPVKAISPPADPKLPVNYKTLDIEDPTIDFDNKENISPKNTPKKKIVAPSPFRFEKIRSSKRLAAITSTSKSPEKASPRKAPEPEPEAGPSWLDKPKSTVMKQTNLNSFLNLDDMPESANISTPHGIFNDVCSTPVSGKKPRKLVEEANIENAFGFDCDETTSDENLSTVKIATEADVKNSVKGKLFPKARVKSAVPARISENTVKTLLQNVLKKKVVEKAPEVVQEQEESSDSSGKENYDDNDQKMVQYEEPPQKDKKKIMLDAISFSDTFDVLSETGEELEAKVPEEMPLFLDLEPAHFTEPPRRSYNKRKRNVCFDFDRYESSDEDDEEEENKKKKAKKRKKHNEPHLNKEEKKRMENWVKNVNKTFDEIEHFDLVVE